MTNKQILLVDDEPNIVISLEFLMRQQGYQVTKAYNGSEALHQMESLSPDIVILDVMMPEMDGFEVAKRIRTNPQWEDTRIVFLTAKDGPGDRLNGYANGGEVYIAKPFDNDTLVEAVNELVAYG